jgi:hypothetical protein
MSLVFFFANLSTQQLSDAFDTLQQVRETSSAKEKDNLESVSADTCAFLAQFLPTTNYFDEYQAPTDELITALYEVVRQQGMPYPLQKLAAVCLLQLAPTVLHRMVMLNRLERADLKELITLKDKIVGRHGVNAFYSYVKPLFEMLESLEETSLWYQRLMAFPHTFTHAFLLDYKDYQSTFFAHLPFIIHVMILRVGFYRGQIGVGGTEMRAGDIASDRMTTFQAMILDHLGPDDQPEDSKNKGRVIYEASGLAQIMQKAAQGAIALACTHKTNMAVRSGDACVENRGNELETILMRQDVWDKLNQIKITFAISTGKPPYNIIIQDQVPSSPQTLEECMAVFKKRDPDAAYTTVPLFLFLMKNTASQKSLALRLQEILFENGIIHDAVKKRQSSHILNIYQFIKTEGFDHWIYSLEDFFALLTICKHIAYPEMTLWFITHRLEWITSKLDLVKMMALVNTPETARTILDNLPASSRAALFLNTYNLLHDVSESHMVSLIAIFWQKIKQEWKYALSFSADVEEDHLANYVNRLENFSRKNMLFLHMLTCAIEENDSDYFVKDTLLSLFVAIANDNAEFATQLVDMHQAVLLSEMKSIFLSAERIEQELKVIQREKDSNRTVAVTRAYRCFFDILYYHQLFLLLLKKQPQLLESLKISEIATTLAALMIQFASLPIKIIQGISHVLDDQTHFERALFVSFANYYPAFHKGNEKAFLFEYQLLKLADQMEQQQLTFSENKTFEHVVLSYVHDRIPHLKSLKNQGYFSSPMQLLMKDDSGKSAYDYLFENTSLSKEEKERVIFPLSDTLSREQRFAFYCFFKIPVELYKTTFQHSRSGWGSLYDESTNNYSPKPYHLVPAMVEDTLGPVFSAIKKAGIEHWIGSLNDALILAAIFTENECSQEILQCSIKNRYSEEITKFHQFHSLLDTVGGDAQLLRHLVSGLTDTARDLITNRYEHLGGDVNDKAYTLSSLLCDTNEITSWSHRVSAFWDFFAKHLLKYCQQMLPSQYRFDIFDACLTQLFCGRAGFDLEKQHMIFCYLLKEAITRKFAPLIPFLNSICIHLITTYPLMKKILDNCVFDNKRTFLHVLCDTNYLNTTELDARLKLYTSVDFLTSRDEEGRIPLEVLLKNKKIADSIKHAIIAKCFPTNDKRYFFYHCYKVSDNPLLMGAHNADSVVLPASILTESGLRYCDNEGNTWLHYACANQHIALIMSIINARSATDFLVDAFTQKNRYGTTPLGSYIEKNKLIFTSLHDILLLIPSDALIAIFNMLDADYLRAIARMYIDSGFNETTLRLLHVSNFNLSVLNENTAAELYYQLRDIATNPKSSKLLQLQAWELMRGLITTHEALLIRESFHYELELNIKSICRYSLNLTLIFSFVNFFSKNLPFAHGIREIVPHLLENNVFNHKDNAGSVISWLRQHPDALSLYVYTKLDNAFKRKSGNAMANEYVQVVKDYFSTDREKKEEQALCFVTELVQDERNRSRMLLPAPNSLFNVWRSSTDDLRLYKKLLAFFKKQYALNTKIVNLVDMQSMEETTKQNRKTGSFHN